MARAPVVKLRKAEPLQDYYQDREGNRYSVARLIDDSKDLQVFACPVAALCVGDRIWEGENIIGMAYHFKKVMDADLTVPIIIDWNGDIADGRHRLIRAIAEGKRTLPAVRITWKPDPCRPCQETAEQPTTSVASQYFWLKYGIKL